jgi:succinyl-diaminopimelate desuccinylase
MDERVLAQRLLAYDTSTGEGINSAVEFVRGWLEARDIRVREATHRDLAVLVAEVGGSEGPAVVFHAHVDVVPARPGQFEPRVEGDRLIGRGSYDMKGGLAAMMCALADVAEQSAVRVIFVCVPDEESEDVESRSTDMLIAEGLRADFAITGEPTDLHIGIQAKGVLAITVELAGRAAHGSTPWLGDNAILKAYEAFRRMETLPFTRESSELFERPSINLARIHGGDAFNKVPDTCLMDVDIRYLPTQDPGEILAQLREIPDLEVKASFSHAPANVPPNNPFVVALREAVAGSTGRDVLSVGREGASDAICFVKVGIPAVEFGPVGAGHHGPDEWVSLASLSRYREALRDFVYGLPAGLARSGTGLRAVEGGRAS